MKNQTTSQSQTSNTNNIETAAAYLRVSTTKQKETGHSIEYQRELAEEYAIKHGWELKPELIFNEDKSASRIVGKEFNKENLIDSYNNRPELQKLLSLAQQKKFTHLIVHTRDRLSRVLEESIVLGGFFKAYGIDIHYTKESENLNNEDKKINRLLHIILSSIAELESNVLSTRVKEGNRSCLKRGLWPGGRAPLGYYRKSNLDELTNKRHSILVKSSFESKLVSKVFRYYLDGLGYKKIADKMNKEYGFIEWTQSKIESIIKNQTYTGQIAWDRRGGRRNSKKHSTFDLSPLNKSNVILDDNTWNKVSNIRTERSKHKDAFFYDTPFIFKNKLVCAKCGRIMKPRNPGKSKSNVYKCAISKEDRSLCNCIIPSYLIEDRFNRHIKDIFECESYNTFWNVYCEEFDKKIEEYKTLINELNKNCNNYSQKLIKLEALLSKENDDKIKTAIQTRHTTISKLINKYKQAISIAEEKISHHKVTKEELTIQIENLLPYLFNENKDDVSSDQVRKYKRAFINKFIDKIIVDYDKKNKEITKMEVVFIPPKFI